MRAHVPFATIVVLVSAGSAFAGDGFEIGGIDAGGVTGSDPLAQLSVIGGTIYQNAFGNDFEPNNAFFGAFPDMEFDSYIAIDSGPVTASYDGSSVSSPTFAPGSGMFTATSLSGAWFVSSIVDSFLNPTTDLHEIFVARITHTGVLSGYLGTTISEDHVTPHTVGSGLGASFNSDTTGTALLDGYIWVTRESTENIGGTDYTVSDIYLQQGIPTPGALALLGAGGLVTTRRRRR